MLFLLYLVVLIILILWVEDFSIRMKRSRPSPATVLEIWIQNHQLNPRQETKKNALPDYKFFTPLIKQLLYFRRTYGAEFQDAFNDLRASLILDQAYEKKLKSIVLGAYFQAAFIFFVTWTFITACIFLLNFKLNTLVALALLFWQILGLILFVLGLRMFRWKTFHQIEIFWFSLCTLRSLAHIPMSLNDIFSNAKLRDLEKINQKELLLLRDKIFEGCRMALKKGASFQKELPFLVQELKQVEQRLFEQFEKKSQLFKLLLLAFFFLPSYLGFIFCLLKEVLKTI